MGRGVVRVFVVFFDSVSEMTDSSYSSPAKSYGSPARNLKMLDKIYGSPARSYNGDHSSATESEGEDTAEFLTEMPITPDQTVMDGWLKFRDNKKVSIKNCNILFF